MTRWSESACRRVSPAAAVCVLLPWLAGCEPSDITKFKKEMEQYGRQKSSFQQDRTQTEAEAEYYVETINGPQRIAPEGLVAPRKSFFDSLNVFKQPPPEPAVRLPDERFDTPAPARPSWLPSSPSVSRSPLPSATGPSMPSMPQAPALPQARPLDEPTRRDSFR